MPIIAKNYNSVLSKVNILVVNNDGKVAEMLRDVLLNIGFGTVITAIDGFEAVKAMKQIDMDLIITDWELEAKEIAITVEGENNNVIKPVDIWSPIPPECGASFIRYIRNSKHSPNQYIAIIMLTSNSQKHCIKCARDAGVNEVMVKPVTAEALCYHIIQVIDHQRAFITSEAYRGPCRRHMNMPPPEQVERRKRDVKIFRHSE